MESKKVVFNEKVTRRVYSGKKYTESTINTNFDETRAKSIIKGSREKKLREKRKQYQELIEKLKKELQELLVDNLFAEFNKNNKDFKERIKAQIIDTDKRDEIADKLFAVLNHFKGEDGLISKETQKMLKNNTAFMKFIGWIFSFLPELVKNILPKPAQDWVKRYEFSEASAKICISAA